MRPHLVAILGALSGVSCADATGSDALTLAAIAGPYQASHYVYQAVGDAIHKGIARADKTLRNLSGAWIKSQKVVIEKGKVTEYRVLMKVSFVLGD